MYGVPFRICAQKYFPFDGAASKEVYTDSGTCRYRYRLPLRNSISSRLYPFHESHPAAFKFDDTTGTRSVKTPAIPTFLSRKLI